MGRSASAVVPADVVRWGRVDTSPALAGENRASALSRALRRRRPRHHSSARRALPGRDVGLARDARQTCGGWRARDRSGYAWRTRSGRFRSAHIGRARGVPRRLSRSDGTRWNPCGDRRRVSRRSARKPIRRFVPGESSWLRSDRSHGDRGVCGDNLRSGALAAGADCVGRARQPRGGASSDVRACAAPRGETGNPGREPPVLPRST
mmetsp:Transcript_30974/g.100916  ORF Transcript_30974/g.100916 Transcript_30974/m.100916 type:complete len:207 (-) Transcript_30974:1973-2593(-)